MKSIERMTLALSGKSVDRLPILTFTNIAGGNLGEQMNHYVLEHADAQFEFAIKELHAIEFPAIGVEFERTTSTSPDGWITRKYQTPTGKVFTDILRYSEGNTYRSYRKHVFHDISEVNAMLALPYLKPEDNAYFLDDVNAFCAVQHAHNTEHEFCCIIINDPLFFLAGNTDPQDMSLWTILERAAVNRYLKEITKRMVEYIDYMLQNFDMNCIFMLGGAEYAIPPLMSPKDFEEFVYSNDKLIIDAIHKHNKKVLVHSHGKINDFIPQFIGMGSDGIHPLEPVGITGDCDISEIKTKYGKEICLVGNVQYDDFYQCSPQQIEIIVRDLISAAKHEGGFILAPACPMYHDHTTAKKINQNLRAFIDAGIKYGRY